MFRRRFLREPKLAAALDHPNVVPIYEAGEHEGRLYLAMRFVDGSDLRTLLRQDGGLPASARWRSSSRSRARSTPRTAATSCTATSSPRTCSSTRTATRT